MINNMIIKSDQNINSPKLLSFKETIQSHMYTIRKWKTYHTWEEYDKAVLLLSSFHQGMQWSSLRQVPPSCWRIAPSSSSACQKHYRLGLPLEY